MFATRLTLALVLMAFLSLAQGALGWWVTEGAERQVYRGRVAGDLQAGFLQLSATKQRLRAWSLRALIGAPHDPTHGEMLRQRMVTTLDRLQELSLEADRLDRAAGLTLVEHQERDQALVLLKQAVATLEPAIADIASGERRTDPLAAWDTIEGVFEVGAGQDLRELLDLRIEREAEALARKRAAADASLNQIKMLAWVTTALLSLLALGLGIYFARALRRPLQDMTEGALAMERGDLGHRVPVQGADEFARFGRSMNQMAEELLARREQEAAMRTRLEVLVAERTAELETALGGLRQSEARRRQLLGDIGHELRTPTTAIRGEAEIALRGAEKDPDEYRAALTRIGQASRQLGTLIDDLLTVARSDAEVLQLDLQVLDINAPLEEAVVNATGVAAQRGVTIVAPETAAPVLVEGDGQRLQQLITILLDNAVRYSKAGGEVRLSAAVEDGGNGAVWRLTVADNGIGIPADDLPHVFERTFRSANARTHRPDGSGLGLAIARTLAERQGGSVTLESQLGVGTTATLTLPVARPMAEAA